MKQKAVVVFFSLLACARFANATTYTFLTYYADGADHFYSPPIYLESGGTHTFAVNGVPVGSFHYSGQKSTGGGSYVEIYSDNTSTGWDPSFSSSVNPGDKIKLVIWDGNWVVKSVYYWYIYQANRAPGQPGTITASSITRTSATVSWGAATDADGDSLTYYVDYKTDLSLVWTSAGSTTSRSKSLTGLEAGTVYDVRVRAYDGSLYGSWRDQENVITTLPPVGSIRATLNNWNGAAASAANTKFILYTSPSQNNVGQNPHTFTDILLGSYWVEGYQNNTAFGEYEYWGSVQASLTANGQTVPAVINRHTPYCEDFWFEYNGIRLGASDKVPPGSTVTAKATVRNRDTTARQTYLIVGWRFAASGAAVGTKQSPTVTINVDSTYTFTVGTVALTSGVENDVYAYVKTYAMFSNWALTDAWDWAKKFEATTGSRPTTLASTVRLRRLEPGIDARASMPAMASGEDIVPGKRYVIEATFSDADGAANLSYATFHLAHPSGTGNLTIDVKPGMNPDTRVWRDSTELNVSNNDYIQKVHIFPGETVNSTQKLFSAMFWLSGKWGANVDNGVELHAWAWDAEGHSADHTAGLTTYGYQALSLDGGRWTVIVHGKSASGLTSYGPWDWHKQTTGWFDDQSRPDVSGDNWMWEMAFKLGRVSKTDVAIHRLNRDGMVLQTWVNGNYSTAYSPSTAKHNILLYDWDEPSDYVDIDDENFDDGHMCAAGDTLFALLNRLGVQSNVELLIGYSRGAVVVSETARRLRIIGHNGFQVVFLDGEGGGEFANEVRNSDFPIHPLDVGPNLWGWMFALDDYLKMQELCFETQIADDLDERINSAAELLQLRRIAGFDDYRFYAWQGCRSDQYRQGYSNPDMAFCGAEAVSGANDRPVEWWPTYSTYSAGRNPYGDGQISHDHYPVYFIDWLYLQSDSTLGGVACAVTPNLGKWEDRNNRGSYLTSGPLQYGVDAPVVGPYMEGSVFNGGLQAGTLYFRDGSTDPCGGSVAGWSYHGGTTPFDNRVGQVSALLYQDGDDNYWLRFDGGLLGTKEEVWHNWLVAPSGASAVRMRIDAPGIFDAGRFGVEWHGKTVVDYMNWVDPDLYDDPRDETFIYSGAGDVGRLKLWTDDVNSGIVYIDNVEFVGGSRPMIGTLTGNPNPVVQGVSLRLVAGGVFDADGSVNEVRFYRDSNGDGDYDDGTDAPFGVAYSGSDGNWEVTQGTAGIPVGQHYFFALAKDSDGLWSAAARSASRIEVTQPVNQAPTVGSLSDSPDPVDRGANLTLTASSVADSDGTVARVEFYHDANNNGVFDEGAGALVGTDTTIVSGQASVTFGTGSLPAGTRRFFAVAYDNLPAASAPVSCRTTIIQKWNLAYQVSPVGSGIVTENPAHGRYADGTQIDPGASAAATYRFDHWEVNGVTKTMPVALTADTTVKAVFVFNGPTVVPPILNAIGNQSVNAGVAFSLTVTKQQGDAPITWILESGPAGMTINASGGISWPNPTPAGSSQFVTVKAANSAGNDAESFTLYVLAPPDTQKPTVQITVPTANAAYTSATNWLNIGGTASDNVGVTSVRARNFRDVGEYTCTGTTSWQYNGLPLFQGLNNICVIAYDAAGNSATDTVSVTYMVTASIRDAWWSDEVDNDGDGYKSQARLNWDPDVSGGNGSLTVIEKIFWKLGGDSTWNHLLTTSPHMITDTAPSDSQNILIDGIDHNIYDCRIEIYRSGQSSADYVRSDTNDADLDNYRMETESEDPLCKEWKCIYGKASEDSGEVDLFRQFRDEVLAADALGSLGTEWLYHESDEALRLLASDPDLLSRAGALASKSRQAIADSVAGGTGTVEDTPGLVEFLDDVEMLAGESLGQLAAATREAILAARGNGEVVMGLRFEDTEAEWEADNWIPDGTETEGIPCFNTARPYLEWTPCDVADGYLLWMEDDQGAWRYRWVRSPEWKADIRLRDGFYQWWVCPWSTSSGLGEWTPMGEFIVELSE